MYPSTIDLCASEEEFLALPETTDRIELLDGEVILPPSPSYLHQRLVLAIASSLRDWALAHPPAAVGVAPLDVRFAAGRILQPDVFVVLAGLPDDLVGPVRTTPEVVVEVLSSARSYDRITKRVVYAEAGTDEYWVVDPELARVEVFGKHTKPRVVQDVLRSRVLAEFALDLAGLFGG